MTRYSSISGSPSNWSRWVMRKSGFSMRKTVSAGRFWFANTARPLFVVGLMTNRGVRGGFWMSGGIGERLGFVRLAGGELFVLFEMGEWWFGFAGC